MTPALELAPAPPARAKSLGQRPAWWLARVERETAAFRAARAERIRAEGAARRREAWAVVEALRDGRIDDWQLYEGRGWRPEPQRHLPGASPEVIRTLWRWDGAMRAASDGRRRLVRDPRESVESWRARVLAECERRLESRWHEWRALGEEQRFERVRACGQGAAAVLRCRTCGTPAADGDGVVRELLASCQAHLLCSRCRLRRRDDYRRRARDGIAQAVARARAKRAHVGADRLSSRFLTLTLPRLAGGPEEQARVVRGAWRRMMNSWRNSWRKTARAALCAYVRVVEGTSGSDETGHVHCHAWVLSPFMRHHRLRAMWGRALIAEGVPAESIPHRAKADILAELLELGDHQTHRWAKHTLSRSVPWPVLDVRAVRAPDDIAAELVKYLCKDLSAGGGELPADLFAGIFRGLSGGRLATASRGFWVRVLCECRACGDLGTMWVVRTREPPPRATGPPGQLALALPA